MIIPRSILLWWVGAWLLPAAVVAAVTPYPADVLYAAGAIVLLIPLIDAIRAGRLLEGMEVQLPELTRLTRDADGAINVHLHSEIARGETLRLGLPLPGEFNCQQDDIEILMPAKSDTATVGFACRPAKRGCYNLVCCYVGAISPWRFWLKRRTFQTNAQVRVYPNLLNERKRLGAMFLNRGGVGIHTQRQVGQGRDFEKLREYIPGDSYDEIHWKATAKRGRPATKIFQLERTQEVYVVIDSSRLSARRPSPTDKDRLDDSGGNGLTMLERFVTAAMVMGLVAERQGDLFGVMSFSDRVENFVRARNGKAHYGACRESLYALQPRMVAPDFSELFAFLRLRLRRRALLVFLTDLDDPIIAETFIRNVPLIARQHLVLVNMIRPPEAREIFTNPDAGTVEDIYRDLSGHLQWHGLLELKKTLQYAGVRFGLMENETFCPQLVSQYLNVKQRQLL
jgi:uncharacterized protein (DUF58 family)